MEPLQFLLYLFPSLMPVKYLCASFNALNLYIKFSLSLSTAFRAVIKKFITVSEKTYHLEHISIQLSSDFEKILNS